ncbi:A24 family peptidase [Citrobacter sp. CK184]|uniref:prepilin peptidase n=1 Tax=unclassified Citrobacter TaxID=2644389 RepID=UPI002577C447|nr:MULTISPECIES: A24 family peptidase [unclassified Citrobacter]MDM3028265.1 A24 family peptidase [Citrobacter sp. CK185]MDM3044885.1 A24 family peptidase [Citrobacter sp. CK184]
MQPDLPFLIIYLLLSALSGIYDARTGLLPDRFTCPLLWSGLLYYLCCLPDHLPDALWGAIAGYGGFALLYWGYRLLYRKEGLGYGDIKFLAALIASINVMAMYVINGKGALKNPLPFGPFLAAAGFIIGWKTLLSGS